MEFVLEWMVDDLPAWMQTRHGPMIAMPYGLDLNDVMIFALEKHTSGEYVRRFEDTLTVLERETDHNPRVLTLALVLRIYSIRGQ